MPSFSRVDAGREFGSSGRRTPFPRLVLLASVSFAALTVAAPQASARSLGVSATVSAPTIAADAAAQAAAQAAAAAAQGSASLNRATAAIQAMQAAQAAARAAAAGAGGVPNGLTMDGLVPDSGLAAPGSARPVVSWTNARTPVQSGPADAPTVTVQQTGAQAILNWSSFNVGSNTSLVFDQQGNASWVALNRVGASASPSQILGSIKADGSVYVINQSGIIFGGGSQINVGSLIASAAAITDSQFLTYGIYSPLSGTYTPSFTAAGGKIVVETGALITTAEPKTVTSGGGSVILLGTEVRNAGSITTPKGQTVMAAGDSFILRTGYSTDSNTTSTTRGVEVAPVRATNSPNGAVTNSGLVFAQQGDITLTGHAVTQDGLLVSTISVDQRGTIHLLNSRSDSTGSVTLTGNAITAVLPEVDSTATAFNSQRDALIAESTTQNNNRFNASLPQFDNLSLMKDREDQSRIEIVSGGLVDFKPNSLTLAQGGQISAYSTKQVLVEAGATLDVSGTTGTVLAASANNLKVNVQPNELRDSPVNRDSGVLVNKDVWIDARDLVLVPAGTGGYASDRYYTKGGLLEVAGYVNNTGHTIGEWTAVGGTVTLTAPNVTAQKGALFDLSGGMVTYAAGDLLSTMVIGADGRIYSIGNAPANLPIISYGGGFTRDHAHWGQTETWISANRGAERIVHQEAYSVGRDAGLLQVYAATSDIQATIDAEVYDGERQTTARPAATTDGYKLTQSQVPLAGRLALGYYNYVDGSYGGTLNPVVFTDAPQSSDATGAGHVFDSAALSSYGLGGISVSTASSIKVSGDLTLAPGGVLDLTGSIDIAANLTAPAGSITLSGDNLTIAAGKALDTSGLWTNLSLDPLKQYGLAYLNGGAISLSATNVTLAAGSRLDASAGGAITSDLKTKGGDGGDITLRATGKMVLDGEFASYGFGKGGKLTLVANGPISIGGVLAEGGVVAANQSFPVDLKLAKDTVFAAGSALPFSITVRTPSLYLPGQTVMGVAEYHGDWNYESIVIGPGGWTVPAGSRASNQDPDSGSGPIYRAGTFLPAGTQINYIYLNVPDGYVLPASAFPNGLSVEPRTLTVAAGSPIPVAYTVAAGTLIAKGTVLQQAVAVQTGPAIADAATFFSRGFSSYNLTSPNGVYVLPGTEVQVTQPVFQFTAASFSAPTGSDPQLAAPVVLPPLFLTNPSRGTITQRAGADLVIGNPNDTNQIPGTINNTFATQGAFWLGRGASITVDPGRSVSVGSTGQITIEGSITARGGSITLVNNARLEDVTQQTPFVASGRSVWIDGAARLDVSGLAFTDVDLQGRRIGVLSAGGSVVLGALNVTPQTYGLRSGNAFVVIRPGAIIDASGSSATVDLVSSSGEVIDTRSIASDGGLIALVSQWGIYNDGSLSARAGGAGASGGTLVYTLETPPIGLQSSADPTSLLPADARAARVITLAQTYGSGVLPANLVAGATSSNLLLGQARLGVDQIEAGGFSSLSLWARGAVAFDGDVSLSLSRSLTLSQGPLMNTKASGVVSLAAPYVLLDGMTVLIDSSISDRALQAYYPNERVAYPAGAALTISGDLVDIRNQVRTVYRDTNVISSGDLRFLAASGATVATKDWSGAYSASTDRVTTLGASGNLTLTAAQIYPATGARAVVSAGVTQAAWQGALTYGAAGSVLTIRRNGDTPAMPYSLFGSLELYAETVYQGGVVRAPFGTIVIGGDGAPHGAPAWQSAKIELLPGSITSVSTDGLVMPYGGTSDGVNYLANGVAATFADAMGAYYRADGSKGRIGITLGGRQQTVDAGALLDLSGGGEITGAAFVTGRGGSVDVLMTPLVNADPANTYSSAGNKVYAIVPGVVTAPVAGGYSAAWTGATPGIGQQITIPDGVAGLPAGTYTLLPASYALLPGAYRVELAAASTARLPSTATLANGSTIVPVVQSVANTSIVSSLPTQAIITPAAVVRSYGQYQEQRYTGYVLAQADQFGALRKMVEADAHLLTAIVRSTAADAANTAFVFKGQADFSGAAGGMSGVFSLETPASSTIDLIVTGAGSTTANTATLTTVSADNIAAVGAPNLLLSSGLFGSYGSGMARNLTIESGVQLTGDSLFLGATNTVTLNEGVIVSTLGRGFSWLDALVSTSSSETTVTPFGVSGTALLVVSNGNPLLGTPTGSTTSIVMKNGSGLYSEGSIGFYADRGLSTQGRIGLGTRRLALNAASLNIGTEASLAAAAGSLPAGLNLTQTFLDALLAGGGIPGAPAVQYLTLGASNGINFFGDVTLSTIDPATGKSRLDGFVLVGPSIYGYGDSTDTARIVTDTLIWQGATAPVARIGGLGNAGAFIVDAREILFGYSPTVAQPSGANFNRLMLGFDNVVFGASERITANSSGTLSVYGSGAAVTASFDPATYVGTGNTLTLRTPLMTTESGASFSLYGNAVNVTAPAGSSAAAAGSLGGTLSITGDTLTVASAIVLPAGRLSLTARTGDLILSDAARLDVAGHPIDFNGVTRQAWAGDIFLTSVAGNVVAGQGSVIDLSSEGSDAGNLTIKAAAAARLAGALKGRGGGNGARDGAFNLTAGSLGGDLSGSFAALNQALSTGGFAYSRSFAFSSGDLVVGNDVRARNVAITVNGGSLTVAGRIDASGSGTGSIRLSARDDVHLTGSAVLDVHGTSLVRDGYGQVIEASNRNSVEINTGPSGWLRLDAGAGFDLSSIDGVARGRVDLNPRRSSETGGDVRIDASGPLVMRGVGSLAVNAYWTYSPTDANGTIVQDNTVTGVPAGAVGLKQIDATNQTFYTAAEANTALQSRLAGLKNAAGGAYHFRPGVEIVSSSASGGKLTVLGDLDLAGYRYGPDADRNPSSATYGFGEPLALAIRASGNLDIKGSITDGFGVPNTSPDENNFRDRTISTTSQTDMGLFPGGFAVVEDSSKDTAVGYFDSFDWWAYVFRQPMTLVNDWTNTEWTAIKDSTGRTYAPGTVVPAGTTLVGYAGGYPLLFNVGTVVPDFRLIVTTVSKGKIYAIAPMLAAGAMSADIRLVSGADLASADSRALRSAAAQAGSGNMTLDDYHTHTPSYSGYDNQTSQIASVIRTGTGDLDLLSGGSLITKSLFGIYTAGTQSVLGSGDGDFVTKLPSDSLPTTALMATLNERISYYPDHGGDLRVVVQGDYTGYQTNQTPGSGNWLIRQGANEIGQKTAWSVNFGKYYNGGYNGVYVDAVNGFGSFGGGNATISIGGNAGGIANYNYQYYTGLVVTVASTGRVLGDGTLIETGGGALDIAIGGKLNQKATGGIITDLRGAATLTAAQIGALTKYYNRVVTGDPRPTSPLVAGVVSPIQGPNIALGDATLSVRTRGDLVLGSVADPGILETATTGDIASPTSGRSVASWFALMRPTTTLDLVSLGGDIDPTTGGTLPPIFRAAADSGNIYLENGSNGSLYALTLTQEPAPRAEFELLARNSIFGGIDRIIMSAADPALLPTPFHPAFVEWGDFGLMSRTDTLTVYDVNNQIYKPTFGLFALSKNVATGDLHAGDPNPVRIYAVNGDIVGVQIATAKRLEMIAGGDIVANSSTGTAGGTSTQISILHADATDVSAIQAGGRIIYPDVSIAGPGTLSMTAGGDINLADKGNIVSTGPAYAADLRSGASISLLAGAGKSGADYAAVAALYLDPANQAAAGTPLADQPGKVAKTYETELKAWLKTRYGYAAKDDADARAYFGKLAAEQQAIFLRQVYFAELKAGGREYNDPTSSRYGSYLRGRQMIATLFPDQDAGGKPITYDGDITIYSGFANGKTTGGGVRTVGGGDIDILTPGGRQLIGVEGVTPPAASGVITQGKGDINLYAKNSILLGLSRIMTTYGGSILAWSATGDINAGRGSKTTQVYTPPKRLYDLYGNVKLSPQAPSTGAGIATLNPVPGTTPGDIDLIAPLGTIDAGEAGIRVSGNINLAALQIVNAANIQVQGTSAGLPTVQGPPVAALTTANNVAGAATPAAAGPAQDNDRPSVILVEFLGFGGGDGGGSNETPRRDNRRSEAPQYNPRDRFQIIGNGELTERQKQQLTEDERRGL